jgi:membrane protein implicated in regulation of membrane protease activity
MIWWMWVLLGLVLLVIEVVTPGAFFTLFFGVGAICVAVLSALGVVSPAFQWIAFAAISVVLVLLLRGRLQEKLRARDTGPIDELVGQEVVLMADLPAGGETKAELRGSPWSARAASGIPLAKGQRCRVERVDGVMLYVTAIEREGSSVHG